MEMTAAEMAAHVRKEFAKIIVGQTRCGGPTTRGDPDRRPRADRRRAGAGENAGGEMPGASFQSAVSARAVHSGPDSRGYSGRQYLPAGRRNVSHEPRASVHRSAAGG